MGALDHLYRELSAWGEKDLLAGFWWRDDDLGTPTTELDLLLGCAGRLEVEPVLAVVPIWASSTLITLI